MILINKKTGKRMHVAIGVGDVSATHEADVLEAYAKQGWTPEEPEAEEPAPAPKA